MRRSAVVGAACARRRLRTRHAARGGRCGERRVRRQQRVVAGAVKGAERLLLKMHGCVTAPEDIVITTDDYAEFDRQIIEKAWEHTAALSADGRGSGDRNADAAVRAGAGAAAIPHSLSVWIILSV